MRQILTLIFFASITGVSQAQFYTVSFNGFQTQPCFSGEGNVTTFNNLFVYQTTNDLWDGDLDSTACIDLLQHPTAGRAYLDVADAHPNRPIFIKKEFNVALSPNAVFAFSAAQYNWIGQVQSDCSSLQMCSGLYVNIRVPAHPDSLAEFRVDQRFLPFVDSSPLGWMDQSFFIDQCLATEYFAEQTLESLVWMISPTGEIEGQPITLSPIEMEGSNVFYFSTMPFTGMNWSYVFENDVHTYVYSNWFAFLIDRPSTAGYPSPDNMYYIDVLPSQGVNLPTQENIVIQPSDLEWANTLTFHPYTAFRGALVEGEEMLRHNLEFIVPEYGICDAFTGEILIEQDVTYTFKSNRIDLSNTGCLLFKWGAHFKVAEESYVQYSRSGDGMLGLMAGSDIVLERNATLEIGCAVGMWDDPNAGGVSVAELYLHPGSTLRFKAGSSIKNATSGERMKLRLHMLGGIADLDGLPPADLRHFEFVYPERPAGMAVEVLGEARHGQVNIRWWGLTNDLAMVHVFDLNGRMLSSDRKQQQPGWNYTTIATPTAADGLMVLQIATSTRQGAKKFYMQR